MKYNFYVFAYYCYLLIVALLTQITLCSLFRMAKVYPLEYNFVPQTWILPTEYSAFQQYAADVRAKKAKKTYIVKPVNGAMGNGYVSVRLT